MINTKKIKLSIALAFITATVLGQRIDYKGFAQWSWHKQDSTEYYLYIPDNIVKGTRYPVALFLHGCCGDSYRATLRNAVDPPVRMWHNFGDNTQVIPTYIISPATSRGWSQHMVNIKAVIDKLIEEGIADPQRIYITGFSMGSRGTWQFLDAYPKFFAAAIPMGFDFFGTPEKIRNIPIWTIKGETDWHARTLDASVLEIRKANGYKLDSSYEWATGVNPLLTVFKNMGHVVQWEAASTLPLVTWAYSKVNDGNLYPTIMFETPSLPKQVKQEDHIHIKINANDEDGNIARVEFFANSKPFVVSQHSPYEADVVCDKWGVNLRAVAYDNKGKSTETTLVLYTGQKPTILSTSLPPAEIGRPYHGSIEAIGSGLVVTTVTSLPENFSFANGLLSGVPMSSGTNKFNVRVFDAFGHVTDTTLSIVVRTSTKNALLISDAVTYQGQKLAIAVAEKNVSPYLGSDTEVTFSNLGTLKNLLLIKTPKYDSATVGDKYMSFNLSAEAEVFIAYEKLENIFHSTVPKWLDKFEKQKTQIVTQYYYYDVYSKIFPKGKVVLPDANEIENGVSHNYFILIGPSKKK